MDELGSSGEHESDGGGVKPKKKRKRGAKTQFGYSNEVLDAFESSKIYGMIDNV